MRGAEQRGAWGPSAPASSPPPPRSQISFHDIPAVAPRDFFSSLSLRWCTGDRSVVPIKVFEAKVWVSAGGGGGAQENPPV